MASAWVHQDSHQVAKRGEDKASWYCSWMTPEGKRRTKSCGPGARGKMNAEKLRRKVEAELLTGTYREQIKTEWAAFRKEFEEKIAAGMESGTRRLTADELAALPEDPEELARVLALLAGGDADIRVNGFRGGRMPLGTQIQDIRIYHDLGAASSGGGPRVEIQTVTGGDSWRNNAGMTLRDEALDAHNSFSGLRPTSTLVLTPTPSACIGATRRSWWLFSILKSGMP